MSSPKSDAELRALLEVAKLADEDGDEWDMDDVPAASLSLASACNPRAVIALVSELLALRARLQCGKADAVHP